MDPERSPVDSGRGGGGGGYSGTRGTRVYVGGLDENTKKEDLEYHFNKFGKLSNVWVAYNPPGFAFIEFFDRREAEAAVEEMNNAVVLGSRLRVEISRGRGGRGGGRGFGGRGGGPGRYDRDDDDDDRGRGGFRGRGRGFGGGGGFRGRGSFRGSDRGMSRGGSGGPSRFMGGESRGRGGYRSGEEFRGGPPKERRYPPNGYVKEPRYRSRSPVYRFSGGRREFNSGGDSYGGRTSPPSYPRNSNYSNSGY